MVESKGLTVENNQLLLRLPDVLLVQVDDIRVKVLGALYFVDHGPAQRTLAGHSLHGQLKAKNQHQPK